MAFLDMVFRRVGEMSPPPDKVEKIESPRLAPAQKMQPGGSKLYRWSFVIHKWAGLIGGVWLAVLGLTGFLLNHDEWRWMQQGKAPTFLTPADLKEFAARNVTRYHQIDPADADRRIAGGPRGLWFSTDGAKSWTPTRFENGDHPQINVILPQGRTAWDRIWFGTDNGVYISTDRGETARPVGLQGEHVTALAEGASPGELYVVVDRSHLYRYDANDFSRIDEVRLAPLDEKTRPPEVEMLRFVHDLHLGKSFFGPATSLAMNDLGGLGMLVLSITGLLYWGLPKYWKHKAQKAKIHRLEAQKLAGARPASATRAENEARKAAKKTTIVWLFRAHSATIGIASVVMLLYLSVTGILLGHGRELFGLMRMVKVPQAYLTPAFGMTSWDGWIDSVVAYPGAHGVFTLGTRIGMFTTADGGETFAREEDAKGAPVRSASRLRRIGERVFNPNGMAGATTIRADSDPTEKLAAPDQSMDAMIARMVEAFKKRAGGAPDANMPGMTKKRTGMGGMEGMFMPTDVTQVGDRLLWKSGDKLFATDTEGRSLDSVEVKQPDDPGVTWFHWLLRLHMGTIFWSEFKWINDVFAILAVFLTVTGLIRWWRRKWI